jgi:hypothetical protein
VLEIIGAGEGNRTLVFSLEGCCSTIELHPHIGGSTITLGRRPQPLCTGTAISPDIAKNRFANVLARPLAWPTLAASP